MGTPTEQQQRTARTIDTLRRLRGYSDARLGKLANMSRSQVEARRSGRAVVDVNDLERLGKALGVPAPILLMDEREAIGWVAEHSDTLDLRNDASGWLHGTADPTLFDLVQTAH